MYKLVKIIQWDSWTIPKNTVGPMNNNKNKLNSKIR